MIRIIIWVAKNLSPNSGFNELFMLGILDPPLQKKSSFRVM